MIHQVEYREQSKNKIKRQLEIARKTATDEELEQMLEVIIDHSEDSSASTQLTLSLP